ncbi:uracil-DNA glycosylase [Clostridia bacterium]|nr:uracil-DNA glycosylase [Clostridia bacterium]
MKELMELHKRICECRKCSLCETRVMPVVDDIPENTIRLMLIGEAPGGHEATISGRPFSGQAGEILDDFLHTINLERKVLYVSNLVKCRPVKPSKRPRYGLYANRKPSREEVQECSIFLEKEVQILEPELLVTLGKTPLEWCLGRTISMKDVHGQMLYSDILHRQVYAMYHPASLIYNRALASKYTEDLERLSSWLHEGAIREI